MGIRIGLRNGFVGQRISQAVSELPKSFGTSFRAYVSPLALKLILAAVTSLVLGILAYQGTSEQVLQLWLKSHAPSSLIWHAALETQGLHEISDPRMLQKISKTLPSQWDPEAGAWVEAQQHCLCLYENEPEAHFSILCGQAIQMTQKWQWEPLGSGNQGWAAFEQALSKATEWKSQLRVKIANREPISRDPREIRY